MKKDLTKYLILQLVFATILIIPLLGILRNYDQELAVIDLGDPIKLFFSYKDFMEIFRTLIYVAIGCSLLPWTRKFYGLCIGICLGGLLFLYLDKKAEIKMLSDMELSQTPLEEMIQLTAHGEKFAFWCIATVVCFSLVMIAECVVMRFNNSLQTKDEVHQR